MTDSRSVRWLAGGLTLYFRHTATDFSQNDAAMTTHEACATQRNLSQAGRAQARDIGAAIRRMQLPVVQASSCRCMRAVTSTSSGPS